MAKRELRRWVHGSRQNGAPGQQTQCFTTFWECAFSHGGGITEDDAGAIDFSTADVESSDTDDYWTKTGLEWKTVARNIAKFDAGLEEFTKTFEANHERSMMVTMRHVSNSSDGQYVKHKHG